MKFWKLTLLTVSLFTALSATVLFTACEKDACTDLKCKNGSACTEGFCRCPTGYEGAECEFKTSSRFLGTFVGSNYCNQDPSLNDTMDIRQVAEPNIVEFSFRHNSPGETFRGTVDGYTIVVADEVVNGYLRKAQAVLDHDHIMVLFERSSAPEAKTVCTFNGQRKR